MNKIIDVDSNKLHDSGNERKAVDTFVTCGGCGKHPIVEVGYKCAVCKDFDYCEECEVKYCDSQQCHSRPELNPRSISCCVSKYIVE